MIVRDGEALRRIERVKAQEDKLQKFSNNLAEKSRLEPRLYGGRDSKVDPDVNRGHVLTAEEFEKRLLKLDPDLMFRFHPTVEGIKTIHKLVDGKDKYITCYHPVMQERSVISTQIDYIPDVDIFLGKKKLTRADIGKSHFDEKQGKFIFDDPTAGFIPVRREGREVHRGWRSVLIRLLMEKILTKGQIEKEFGNDNTPEWQEKFHNTDSGIVII